MLGALKLSAPPPAADTLTRFALNVETRAQAQAIQTFLWCLWLSALHQTRSGYATEVKHATTGQSYWKVDVGGRNDDGQLKTATLGGILTVNHAYSAADNLGRIATINVTSGGNPLLAQSFDFESVGNLKGRSLTGTGRAENENFNYDTLDRLLQTSGTGITDAGSNSLDLAGNLSSKAGLLLGYAANSNRLCAIGASTCGAGTGTGAIAYDGNGNIQSYTRPTATQSNNAPGADGALLQLNTYTAFNLPTSISKSLGGAVTASAEFAYDAGYQRTRQIKRSGPTQTGTFVDDILYVVPGGFEVHRNATGQIIKSIATVSGSDGVVATVTANFDAITGMPFAQLPTAQNPFDVSSNNSGTNTVTKLILKDHLGSMVAEITLGGTAANPVVLVNTLTIHGFGPWGNARNAASALAEGQRGFTGHEHLADLGLIHMNGRLYDPVIGRFLQADPIIQAPQNAQSHNRYSYVLNNPLSFTDPSGFSFWSNSNRGLRMLFMGGSGYNQQTMRLAAAIVVSYFTAGVASAWAVSLGASQAVATVVGATAGGFAAGGINGGNIQSALRGAFTAALTAGVLQGIEGLASGAGGAEGGLTVPSPAIDYLRNADGTATSFAGPASLGDWYPNAQGQFEVIGSRVATSGALQPGGMGAVLGDLFTMSIPGMSLGSCVASGCSGWGWFGGAVGSLPLVGAAIRPAAPLATAAPAMTEGLVYRAASGTPKSMTAPSGDLNGLSACNNLQTALPGKNQIIDVSKLNNLCARCDNIATGHVSIMPKDVTQLEGWMASRLTGELHPLTRELMNAVVGTVKK